MKSKSLHSVFSIFLLSAFLLLKVADAHAFSHFSDDFDANDCELCQVISDSKQLKPVLNSSFVEVEEKNVFFLEKNTINAGYEAPMLCIACPSFVYNKPPPLL
ncbi:hypothetical protein [Pseudotenacibaculum haliotis]|uniref:Uncharacterized protein n=1 Tax=Pseudotenacibaculum haliotis TaxID=1862138 RepID=A0ABW5LUX4_9FLAO